MDIKLINECFKLKDLIHDTTEYKELIKAENEMNKCDEVKILSYKMNMASLEYEDALKHFSKNSKEVFEKSKLLADALFKLNSHPLVKTYKEKLDKLNSIYSEIDKELFGDINA